MLILTKRHLLLYMISRYTVPYLPFTHTRYIHIHIHIHIHTHTHTQTSPEGKNPGAGLVYHHTAHPTMDGSHHITPLYCRRRTSRHQKRRECSCSDIYAVDVMLAALKQKGERERVLCTSGRCTVYEQQIWQRTNDMTNNIYINTV